MDEEHLHPLVHEIMAGHAARHPGLLSYEHLPGMDPGASIHVLKRLDRTPPFGIRITVEPDPQRGWRIKRNALHGDQVDRGFAAIGWGDSSPEISVNQWVEELLTSNGQDWR